MGGVTNNNSIDIGDVVEVFDNDACLPKEVKIEFASKFQIADEKAVSLNDNYVIKMCGLSNKIGIAVSDSSCEVYSHDGSSLRKTNKFSGHKETICDVRFSPSNEHLLYSGSSDGSIKVWDTRAGDKFAMKYEENPETKEFTKPLSSFDLSCDQRVLCGGTSLAEGDAYLLFWDVRGKDLLGAYWNSHTDDVVQVQFSKENSEKLVSGSIDGLINVYNITEHTEDDALQYSLATDCAVDKLSWTSRDTVACVTDNLDLQIWNVETADQLATYTRQNVTEAMLRTSVGDCYIVDTFITCDNQLMILAGSYSDKGQCLRTLKIEDNELQRMANFEGNKQIVRCSWYDKMNNAILTGGESGFLSLWQGKFTESKIPNQKTKMTKAMEKLNIRKRKPY